MTEDEAKTRACCGPFAGRMPYGSAEDTVEIAVQGTDPDYAAETAARWPCIGSACMAWRWGAGPFEVVTSWGSPGDSWTKTRDHTADLLPQWTNTRPNVARPGFCGLAGSGQ